MIQWRILFSQKLFQEIHSCTYLKNVGLKLVLTHE